MERLTDYITESDWEDLLTVTYVLVDAPGRCFPQKHWPLADEAPSRK